MVAVAALTAGLLAGCGGDPATATKTAPPAGGAGTVATKTAPPPGGAGTLTVTSSSFAAGGTIGQRYTCRGAGARPALAWTGDRHGATALAVVVHDPDAPSGDFTHWVVLDLPAATTGLGATGLPAGATETRNSGGRVGWTPPCPPSGRHHYHFAVYALRGATGLPAGGDPAAARSVIAARTVAWGEIVGTVSGG